MTERFDALILGSGNGGMYLAWHLAQSGQRTAVVERRWIGGSCPNINCLPTKNEISSAKVVDLARHAETFGLNAGVVTVDMEGVRRRKRDMVDYMIDGTRKQYENSGAELIMGSGRFVAPRTLEVQLNRRRNSHNDGRSRLSEPRDTRSASRRSRTRRCRSR